MHAPGCQTTALVRLLFLHKRGEPPSDPKHEIVYDHDMVEICPSCNGATLERLRHDCSDFEEVWDQYEWYELSPEDCVRLREVASRCGKPLNAVCGCDVHQSLRQSMRALPTSKWNAVFETEAHRHTIRLSAVGTPRFTLVRAGVAAPPPARETRKPKLVDTKGVMFIFLAWPAVYFALVAAWFGLVHLPWFIDAPVVFVAIPVSFVVAGVVLSFARVIAKRA